MSDTFTVAGTSIKKGVKSNRFANGTAEARAKVLLKDNHTEVMLFNLPSPMTKEAAIEWLRTNSDAKPIDPAAVAVKPAGPPKERQVVVKTGTAKSTFKATMADLDDMKNPIFRAVYEAGEKEMQVSAAQEVEAMELHSLSSIAFLPWPQLTPTNRNEFRAMTIHCPKVKAA